MKSSQYKQGKKLDEVEIYLDQIHAERKRLSSVEERDLVEKAKIDEIFKEELLLNTLWVVPAIARKFQGSYLSFIDLIREGNLGLMKAINSIQKYEGRSKFSTYTGTAIKNEIINALRKEKLNRKISLDTLIRENLKVNLDDNNLEDCLMGDIGLKDEKIETPEKIVGKKDELENIMGFLKKLNTETQIIFGKYFYEDKNMREIAVELDYAPSTICKKIKKGLKKLRNYVEAA